MHSFSLRELIRALQQKDISSVELTKHYLIELIRTKSSTHLLALTKNKL